MLPGRIATILNSFFSYKKYGVLLLVENKGIPSALSCCDDLGLYMYIPFLSSLLSFDPLSTCTMFFSTITILFFIVVASAFFSIVKDKAGYAVIAFGLYRLMHPLKELSDVYLAYILPFMALPLVLVAIEKKNKKLFLASFFLCGFVGSFSNIIRIFSFLPVFVFFIILLVFNTLYNRYKKIVPLLLLLIGYSIPYIHFKYVLYKRDFFLEQKNNKQQDIPTRHVFWHNMYLGFGFLKNKYDISWEDSCGERHARQVVPGVEVGSPVYEKTIRDFILNLIKTDRYFVCNTLFAKLGVLIFFFFLYFGFLGLLASYFVPKAWYIELAFLCCAGVSALPGLLTLPSTAYLMGFIVCVLFYTIYSLLYFLNHNGFNQVRKSFKSFYILIKKTQ